MLSDNEVLVSELRRRVGKKRRAHTRKPPKNRKGSAKFSKRRKVISVGPTAVESPVQGVAEEINKGGGETHAPRKLPFRHRHLRRIQ